VFFFQAQGFFKGEAIGLVGFEADVGFANPGAPVDDGEGCVFRGDLFDADCNLQEYLREMDDANNLIVSISISYSWQPDKSRGTMYQGNFGAAKTEEHSLKAAPLIPSSA
jgi:hypothetical protein